MALTNTKIRNTKPGDKPIKLTDSHGLYLEVRKTGLKLWRYRYRIDGKENLFALGEYRQPSRGDADGDEVNGRATGRFTLTEARQERDRCRGLVRQGIHPSHDRQTRLTRKAAENANTFEAVAREWLDRKKQGGRHTTAVKSNGF
ncbi:MAG: Arm DNA-binding domain-containing protein [Pseudomonadales bacterium]|nr:Arm DNA-binding domain-containing protein [Pseudomonadales bacterium]